MLFHVHQADRDARRDTGRPAHRRGQHRVFGAVAAEVAGNLVRRGERDLEILSFMFL